jgi:hypothetical protein
MVVSQLYQLGKFQILWITNIAIMFTKYSEATLFAESRSKNSELQKSYVTESPNKSDKI